jgi:hypothetical protein
MLRESHVLDNRAIDAPGAVVVLPYGVSLFQRFREMVHDSFRAAGLEEYEYPYVGPTNVTGPTADIMDLENKILFVGTAQEIAQNGPPYILAPTGEMLIYSHWARSISTRSQLPIRMYRRGRYFRPVGRGRHSGRGIFHAVEHDDIFEFHCGYADRSEQQAEFGRLEGVLRRLIETVRVPTLWSTRPPWTNRFEVADAAVAADVPLPLGVTAQIACVYDQGVRFSKPYQIGFRENGQMTYLQQLAGYVSRRLLMCHLMLGWQVRKQLFLHPDLAPEQLAVVSREPTPESVSLVALANASGLRARQEIGGERHSMNRVRGECERRGIPIVVQLFAPRHHGEQWKTVISRNDTGEELSVLRAHPSSLLNEFLYCLEDVGTSFETSARAYAQSRVRFTPRSGLEDALEDRMVAVCPMKVSERAVRGIAALNRGEVLGFCRSERVQRCIMTGEPVDTVALISPRL